MSVGVTPDDIAARLGRPLTSAEATQVPVWIGDAEWLISQRADRLGVTVDPDVASRVVALAVTAMAQRPDDATQVDVAVDDGRVSRRYSSSTGRVAILDEWWAELGLSVATGAWTHDAGGPGTALPYKWIGPDRWVRTQSW